MTHALAQPSPRSHFQGRKSAGVREHLTFLINTEGMLPVGRAVRVGNNRGTFSGPL